MKVSDWHRAAKLAATTVGMGLWAIACAEAEEGTGLEMTPVEGSGGDASGTGGADPGGAPGTGGVVNGGAPGTGGVAGGGGGAPPTGSTITACPDAMGFPLETVQALAPCTQCPDARCAPNALVPPDSASLLAACDDTSKCVPEAYAVVGGEFKAKPCRSLNDAEGRCISICVPQVAAQADQLPQADCGTAEKCAPCYNPIDGSDTGACSVACDTGPTEPAIVFPTCGMGRGVCVPPDLVPANLRDIVPPDSCMGGDVCAPKEKAMDLTYKFPSCMAQIAPFDPVPAACVPSYLLDTRPFEKGFLVQATCASGELCAPCVSPLDNMNTGACD